VHERGARTAEYIRVFINQCNSTLGTPARPAYTRLFKLSGSHVGSIKPLEPGPVPKLRLGASWAQLCPPCGPGSRSRPRDMPRATSIHEPAITGCARRPPGTLSTSPRSTPQPANILCPVAIPPPAQPPGARGTPQPVATHRGTAVPTSPAHYGEYIQSTRPRVYLARACLAGARARGTFQPAYIMRTRGESPELPNII